MIVLSGADLVLPDRLLSPGSLLIENDHIIDVRAGAVAASPGDRHFDLHGHYVVPGFVDVHVHGVRGVDVLDSADAVARVAAEMPRYGVTAFCPTSIACSPSVLRRFLGAVRDQRLAPSHAAARVLPAHLESNFLNPDFCGAQPVGCLRLPPTDEGDRVGRGFSPGDGGFSPGKDHFSPGNSDADQSYTSDDLLAEITRAQADIGIVTVAPELPGGIELVRLLRDRGHLVSLGHSGASYEIGREAIQAGASHATHLFNRMPPLGHREPGLAGAVLEADEVTVELVCDGYHVHPAIMRMAIGAKTPSRTMAITDGTAGSGLPVGSRVTLGGQPIRVSERAAFLEDGTLAGSVLTLDKAFRVLAGQVGLTVMDAAIMCSATPARELGLTGCGVIAQGARADLAVLDPLYQVVQTWIGGCLAFSL